MFLRILWTQKAYKCYHPPNKKLYVSADDTFDESTSYCTKPYLQEETTFVEDKVRKLFFLDFPASSSTTVPESEPSQMVPESKPSQTQLQLAPISSTQPVHSTQPNPIILPSYDLEPKTEDNETHDSPRFSQVYSKKLASIYVLMQVQESESSSSKEVTPSSPLVQTKSIYDSHLPISIRKGIREFTKRPWYPLSHFMSFKNCSPSHKSFLMSFNTVSIPTTISKALACENWKHAMNVEMQALEK